MALDLEEQEQVDELKALWKKYGAYITRGVIAFFVLYGLFQGWGYYQTKQSLWVHLNFIRALWYWMKKIPKTF